MRWRRRSASGCALGRDLGTISYVDGRGRPKIVRYWEMTVADHNALRPANEVDDARWVTLADAEGLLTYRHDRAHDRSDPGGSMSGTFVYVIRHAEAGDRKRWAGPDEARPLSDGGRRQAEHLAELFADQPFVQLVSSPFLRCVQTLEPLADARGLPIDLRDELAEGGPGSTSRSWSSRPKGRADGRLRARRRVPGADERPVRTPDRPAREPELPQGRDLGARGARRRHRLGPARAGPAVRLVCPRGARPQFSP